MLLEFRFPEDVFLNDSLEAGHVPEVEESETDHAGGEESVGLRHVKLIADRVKPGHNHHPQEEGGHVDVWVDPVASGELVNVANQMEDPGLVEDSVNLRDEDPESEAHPSLSVEDHEVAGEGRQVVNDEERELFVDDHVDRLHGVHPEAEQETESPRPGGAVEKILPDVEWVVEGPDSPQPRDGGVNTGDECCPPLVVSRPAAPDGGPGPHQQRHRQAAHHLYDGAQQEGRHSSHVHWGKLLAQTLQLWEIFGVSEVHYEVC